jgi:hypothetical protein
MSGLYPALERWFVDVVRKNLQGVLPRGLQRKKGIVLTQLKLLFSQRAHPSLEVILENLIIAPQWRAGNMITQNFMRYYYPAIGLPVMGNMHVTPNLIRHPELESSSA